MRKIILMALCLISVYASAQVQPYLPYRTNGNVLVKDSALAVGTLLIPAYSTLTLGVYADRYGQRFGINTTNNRLTVRGNAAWLEYPSLTEVNNIVATNAPNQTLSLGTLAGSVVISGTLSEVILRNLTTAASSTYANANTIPTTQGFHPYIVTTGSTGYPVVTGTGFKIVRTAGSAVGMFEVFTSALSDSTTYFRKGIGASTFSPWMAFATRNQLNAKQNTVSLTTVGTGASTFNSSTGELNIPVSGTGTVSNVSVVTANGVSGSVANSTTTPAITLALDNITPSSVLTTTDAIRRVLMQSTGLDFGVQGNRVGYHTVGQNEYNAKTTHDFFIDNVLKFQFTGSNLVRATDGKNALFQGDAIVTNQRVISANATLNASTDYTVLVSVSSGADVTATLPTSPLGQVFVIKKVNSAGSGKMIISSPAAIDNGATTLTVSKDNVGYMLQSAGNGQYYVIATIYDENAPVDVVSSASSLTLIYGGNYTFTGTSSTWTLPAISSTVYKRIFVMNMGSGTITVNSNGGSNTIYNSGTLVNTLGVSSSEIAVFYNNGTSWFRQL